MTPILLFFYLVAVAGGAACLLFTVLVFACLWFYLVGGAPKGRD